MRGVNAAARRRGFLRDAIGAQDRTFVLVGVMILVSYAMYAPVILFVQQAPLVGMLMIPKTVAYVVIGFIAYASLYRAPARRERSVLGDASQAS